MGVLLGGLMALNGSPIAFVSDALYMPLSEFLKVFGGGDRLEGMVAIALTLGVVASLLYGFSFYKSSQRLAWHLAVSGAGSGNREE
ncbi:MAG: hypothetical protein HC800_05490 [Phormidesmis sp. RL_2_1]|nr:hypothetical protein [Phormidesmis sp. RL_2_1]